MGETSIYNRVNEVAQQLDSVIESNPWMSTEDFQKDAKFRDLAVQSVSQTGYTFLFDADTVVVRFYRDQRLEGEDLRHIFSGLPGFSSRAGGELEGSLRRARILSAQGGGRRHHETFCLHRTAPHPPCRPRPAHGRGHCERGDFSTPVKETEAIHRATKDYLGGCSRNQAIQSFRHRGLLLMGIGILTVSLLAFAMGLYFSRADEPGLRAGHGRGSTRVTTPVPVPVFGSGEVATLSTDFNRMVDQLGATTVSKQLLQASEARLKEVNNDLRKEIAEREWIGGGACRRKRAAQRHLEVHRRRGHHGGQRGQGESSSIMRRRS